MAKKYYLFEKRTKHDFVDAEGDRHKGWSKEKKDGTITFKDKETQADGDKIKHKGTMTPEKPEIKPIDDKSGPVIKQPEIEKPKDLAPMNKPSDRVDPDKPLPVKQDPPKKDPVKQDPPKKDPVEQDPTDGDGVDSGDDNVPGSDDDKVPGGAFEWFANNWKTVAIVAGAAAIIAGIVALVKGMNKTIKVRYNKVVRTLQRAQKDFTLEDRGLDMRAVMPGVGSRIFDKIAGWWNRGSKKASANGNIGIHPFCNQYKEEIGSDFRQAQEAFSKIKLAADEMEQGLDAEQNANQPQNSSVETKVYDSFREALNSDVLNESEKLDEIGAMAAISTAMTLGGIAVRAGKFLISKFKNGKPDGDGKVVQVTKQSTREICMAIINNYGNKYINMQAVYEQLGISTESLADIDKSSCDKLGQIIKKYQKPEANKITTKQYSRIQKAYENMLKHYYNIGDGIIKNFAKYTTADNEKDENLLVSAKEKLQNMWDSQKDFYDNNFSRIVVEIVGSYSAIAYNDFIVEKVIPVFKSGIAGDADYILDAVPKKGEYYILRQTEGQPWMESGEVQKGNTAIAEITGYDKESKEISFKLIARMENNGNITIDDRGIASVEGDVNYDFYTDGDGNVDEQKLVYGKWLALDPALTEWRPVGEASVIKEYTNDKGDRYVVYGEKDIRDKEEGYSVIYVGLIKQGMLSVSSLIKIELTTHITKEGFESVFEKVKFKFGNNDTDVDVIKRGVVNFKGEKKDEQAGDTDTVAEIINNFIGGAGEDNKGDADSLYTLNYTTAENEKQTMVVFSKTAENKEDSISNVYIAQKKADANEFSAVYKVDVNPELLKSKFADIFNAEDRIKNEQGVVFKFNANDADENVIKTVSETQNPNEEKATNDNDIVAIIARLLSGCKANEEGEDEGGDTPYDEILKKLDEIAKLIEDGFAQQAEALKKLQEFKEFPGLQISINPWNVEIGIKDADGKDINIVIYMVYQESTKTTAYIIGLTGMSLTKFAIVDKLDSASVVVVIKKLIITLKGGKQGLDVIKAYFTRKGKDETYVHFESRLNETTPDVVNCVGFVLPQQGQQQNPQDASTEQPQQNAKFGIVQKGNPSVKGLSIKVEGNDQQQWLHIVDADIYYTKSDMKWQNPTTFSIGISVENIKSAKPNTPVECELKIENNFGIKTNTNIFAAGGKNLKSEIRRLWSQYGQKVADAKILVTNDFKKLSDAKKQQWSSNESVKVSYSHKVMNEGASTDTVITRRFNNIPGKSYVLSESYFDLGRDTSKLSNPSFVKKLKTRGNVFEYVKNNLGAKIFQLTESQTYRVSSYTGYKPSLMTPLYENVYVLRFDSDDNVSLIKYLGKYKIQ